MGDIRKYDDMIGLPHYKSKKRPHMPLGDRAAQFSPFAALKGYEDGLDEAVRYVEEKIEPTEDEKSLINAALTEIARLHSPAVTVTYFRADGKKEGGSYRTVTELVVKLKINERKLVLEESGEISFDDLLALERTDLPQ